MKKSANIDCCYRISNDTNLILPSEKNSNEKHGINKKNFEFDTELTVARPNNSISDEAPMIKALAKLQLTRN